MSQIRDGELQRTDQVVAQRALVTAVVQLEEARAEVRHVDFDWALSGTGFTGQAAGHGVIDLVGEILLPLLTGAGIAQACRQTLEPGHLATCGSEHIDIRLALQAQPFANQRSAALGRMLTLAGGFP